MDRHREKSCEVAPARRGRIVQRVLVDGWSAAQAAAAFGLSERRVARWVAAYRRRGMASLREAAAGEGAPAGWVRRLRARLARLVAVRRRGRDADPAVCVALRRR
jgi:Helix-turn-helix domain